MLKKNSQDEFVMMDEDLFEEAPKTSKKHKKSTRRTALITAGALMLSGAFAAGSLFGSVIPNYAMAETAETEEAETEGEEFEDW